MKTFADFKDIHKGERIIVCGLGESINDLENPEDFITIGVNDIGRKFAPTYLLNVNNRSQYKDDRFSYIENSKASYLFTHRPREQGAASIPIVTFGIDPNPGGIEIVGDRLPHFRNSPYMGVSLAGYMGARRVGVLGVDFTPNHFWTQDGNHRLLGELAQISTQYGKLAAHLRKQGTIVVNLSRISLMTHLPKESLDSWQHERLNVKNTFTSMPMHPTT